MATLENVLSGAGTGAAIGSAVPVIGTAIGAGAGALVGGIGSLIQWYMSQGDDAATGYAAMAGTVPKTTPKPIGDGLMDVEFAEGGMVPGKARKRGDSTANDTVTAALSPGEIVIPRTIAQHPNPAMAGAFVEALRRRKPVAA